MSVNTGGIHSGTAGLTPPKYILGPCDNGGLIKQVQRFRVQGVSSSDPGVTAVPDQV